MTNQAPGSPPEGAIWILCDLRIASEAEVTAFEQRVLATRASLWERFWTTPPLRPSQATFEVALPVYQANRAAIEAWLRQQPELGDARVVSAST